MINIQLDMWPAGTEHGKYSLGRITFANDEVTTFVNPRYGSYNVTVYATNGRVIRRGVVKNWPRVARSRMELLIAGLKACGYK